MNGIEHNDACMVADEFDRFNMTNKWSKKIVWVTLFHSQLEIVIGANAVTEYSHLDEESNSTKSLACYNKSNKNISDV